MKANLLGLILSIYSLNSITAQIELKIKPFNLVFGELSLPAEYYIMKDLGIELTPTYFTKSYSSDYPFLSSYRGFSLDFRVKYYFERNEKGIQFLMGSYLNYFNGINSECLAYHIKKAKFSQVSYGFLLGAKKQLNHNIFLEGSFGIGRIFYLYDPCEATSSGIKKGWLWPFNFVYTFAVCYRFDDKNKK